MEPTRDKRGAILDHLRTRPEQGSIAFSVQFLGALSLSALFAFSCLLLRLGSTVLSLWLALG